MATEEPIEGIHCMLIWKNAENVQSLERKKKRWNSEQLGQKVKRC